jgi:hypothetical protein
MGHQRLDMICFHVALIQKPSVPVASRRPNMRGVIRHVHATCDSLAAEHNLLVEFFSSSMVTDRVGVSLEIRWSRRWSNGPAGDNTSGPQSHPVRCVVGWWGWEHATGGGKVTTASQITRMPNRNGYISQLGPFGAPICLACHRQVALGFTRL